MDMTALASATPASPDLAVDLRDMHKTYAGKVHALRGVDLAVERGGVFGLLGPNGASKSTLVKAMLTVIAPTRVSGSVLGAPVGDRATLKRIGYLPEHHRFPQYLSGRQVIEFFGALAGVPRAERKRRTGELLDVVGMSAWATRRLGTYSKGMQQRVGLAAALVNDPDLVVLDEPTDGVDPVGRREIRDVLARLRAEGRTVLLNSHLLSEVEMVCTRVAIIVQGKVVSRGTIEELTRESARYEVLLREAPPAWALEPSTNGGIVGARVELGAGSMVNSVDPRGKLQRLILPQAGEVMIQSVMDRLRADGVTVLAVTPVRESLEDLFIREVTDPTTGRAHKPGAGGVS